MIGDRMKALRKARKMTQVDLAEASGLSLSSIKQWELGNIEPNARGLCAIADVLDCSIDYLVGRSDTIKLERSEPDIDEQVKRFEAFLRGSQDGISRNSPKI